MPDLSTDIKHVFDFDFRPAVQNIQPVQGSSSFYQQQQQQPLQQTSFFSNPQQTNNMQVRK